MCMSRNISLSGRLIVCAAIVVFTAQLGIRFAEALNTHSVDFERNSTQSFSAPDTSSLDISGTISIEAWIKLESAPTGTNYGIVSKGTGTDDAYSFRIRDIGGGQNQLNFAYHNGSNFTERSWDINIPVETWTHVATVVSPSTQSIRLYVNGIENTGSADGTGTSIKNSAGSLHIGNDLFGQNRHFDGIIDEVRVWNVARTASEIVENMDNELVGDEAGLVGYWTFNGSSLEDATANNNDLTAVNGPTFSSDTPFTGAPPAPDPVIVVPGILGSAEHSGVWEMDPILHTYDDLIATLDANGYTPGTDLFLFPYDWHASNVDTAGLLKQKIDAVKATCACGTVDLVVHSMGGLIARHYMQSASYDNDVDQVVFLGTPHLGAPNAYLMWEGGITGFDLMDKLFSLVLRHEAKEKGYANAVEYAHAEPVSSVEQLLPIYDYLFDSGTARDYPGDYPANAFLENLHGTLGNLLTSGASLYNIIGDTGATTVSGINVLPSDEAPPFWEHGEPDPSDRFVFGSGDGTVPSESASVITDNLSTLDASHRKLPQDAAGDVVEILRGEAATGVVNTIDIPNLKLLVIQMFSPADLLVIAPDGKKIGKDTDGNEINEIPLAFYTGFATDVEFITIPNPEDGEYTIVAEGLEEGPYTIEAHYVTSATATSAVFSSLTIDGLATHLDLTLDTPGDIVTITPRVENGYSLEQLLALVRLQIGMLATTPGIKTSLLKKIANIEKKATKLKNKQPALQSLENIAMQLEKKAAKGTLSDADAAALIDFVAQIDETL
jgi:pimeloyl-ACP methyl ester carboxylesterase